LFLVHDPKPQTQWIYPIHSQKNQHSLIILMWGNRTYACQTSPYILL
jgi:hypothetical protein